MKNSKNCQTTSCGWGHRHELLGFTLLILASVLTVFTQSALAIVAMFFVGVALYCRKFLGCHCCHCGYSDLGDEVCDIGNKAMEKVEKVKKAKVKKVKA